MEERTISVVNMASPTMDLLLRIVANQEVVKEQYVMNIAKDDKDKYIAVLKEIDDKIADRFNDLKHEIYTTYGMANKSV